MNSLEKNQFFRFFHGDYCFILFSRNQNVQLKKKTVNISLLSAHISDVTDQLFSIKIISFKKFQERSRPEQMSGKYETLVK